MSIAAQSEVLAAIGAAFSVSGREQQSARRGQAQQQQPPRSNSESDLEPFTLPLPHAHVAPGGGGGGVGSPGGGGGGGAEAGFQEYAELRIDATGLVLLVASSPPSPGFAPPDPTPAVTLPIGSIFDVFPIDAASQPDIVLRNPPHPHLMQILSSQPRSPTAGGDGGGAAASDLGAGAAAAPADLTVTLALPTIMDCARTARAVARFREAAVHQQSSSSSAPPPGLAVAFSPRALVVPEPGPLAAGELAEGGASGGGIARGGEGRGSEKAEVSEFKNVLVQAVPVERPSGEAQQPPPAYQPCSLRVLSRGIVVEPGPGASGPWTVNWASLSKASARQLTAAPADGGEPPPPLAGRPPPGSHPHAAQLVATCRAGGEGASGGSLSFTSSTLTFAFETAAQLQNWRSAVRASVLAQPLSPERRLSLDVPGKSSQAPSGAPGGGAAAAAALAASAGAVAVPPLPGQSPFHDAGGSAARDGEAMHIVHLNDVPVPLTASMAGLLSGYRAEDAEQPDPLNLEEVWFFVAPACKVFHRCALCVDKLGLTLRPLAEPGCGGGGRDGGGGGGGAGGGGGGAPDGGVAAGGPEMALMTEGLNFPVSAVVDVAETSQFVAPASSSSNPAGSKGSSGAGEQGQQPQQQQQQQRRGPGGLLRRSLPFARALFSRAEAPEGEAVGAADASASSSSSSEPRPPHPHLVNVRVKGALAGRFNGPDKTPAHMRLNAQPPPPVSMYLSCLQKAQAVSVVSKMLAFKKYHLSIALSTHINTFTAVTQRDMQHRGRRLTGEASPIRERMSEKSSAPSLELPPPPPRPPDVPPASRLPRMVTNDEGEVFWYMPRKQQPARPPSLKVPPMATAPAQPAALSGDVEPPVQPPPPLQDPAASSGASFLNPKPAVGVRLQTPRRERPAATTSPTPAASAAAAAAPRPDGSAVAADLDAEFAMPPIETPAPCLSSPTPLPGRPDTQVAGQHHVTIRI